MESLQASRFFIHSLLFLVIIFYHAPFGNSKNSSLNSLLLKKFLLDENHLIEETLFPEKDFRCGPVVNFTMKYGFVKNSDYPNSYKIPTFCQWNIIGNKLDELVTISIDELNIENPNEKSPYCGSSFDSKRCCTQNYLKISSLKTEQYFCGKLSKPNVYISDSNFISITFNATSNRNNAAGFYFSYFITSKFSKNCFSNEFHCLNGKCIPKKWLCNKRNECGDGSDESSCNMLSDFVKCDNNSREYYHISKRCDREFDCRNHTDEIGCKYCDANQFRCLTMDNKCINNSLLCNGIPDCNDFSDEINCFQYCPPQMIRCGSMSHCYHQKLQRCNKVLDCPNGADEFNCFEQCQGKIMCASGDGCYDLEERCNGIVQCADYSDEKNCTLELCRPDKGSFLCTNGRCIPYIWTCDRSADCYDGSDEMRCLKNSTITAAIIGSLICGLLIVIAISCGCKLVALRHLEQYRNQFSINSSPHPVPFRNIDFSLSNPGDLDASLFRMEHSVMFREPPPSYASTMGGYHDINGVNNSYMEQYRRYRRQRRCRPVLRRQHRIGGYQQPNSPNRGSINNESIDSIRDLMINHNDNVPTNDTTVNVSNMDNNYIQIGDKRKEPTDKGRVNSNEMAATTSNDGDNQNTEGGSETATNNDNLNIELEPIQPLTNFDCDSQPLIR